MVLATITVIATLIAGTVYVQTQRLHMERASADASKARLAAESGIEVARAWIRQDVNWRTTRTSGRWATNLVMGDAKLNLDVVDTIDGNLANHPYHGVLITSTARVGDAEQIMTATLFARPIAMDALKYPVATSGQLHIRANGQLIIGTATAFTDDKLTNENTIEGNAAVGSISQPGTVFGTITTGVPSITFPDTSSLDAVAALGTTISVAKLDGITLSSTSNPYGAANPYGVYVIQNSDDFTVNNCVINGTLVFNGANKKVNVTGSLTLQPARTDLPALIVKGDLNIAATSGRITGLIHATKTVTMSKSLVVQGTVISSSSGNDAMDLSEARTITYDPTLYSYAPVGYAKSVDMVLQPGSIQRVVK